MNLDDKALFLDAMEDVQPLKRHTDVHWQPTRNLKTPQRIDTLQLDNFLTTGFLDILPLNEPLEFRREGLQQGVIDKLRSGKYLSRPASICYASRSKRAEKCCFRFILEAQKEGLRNVLIIHGKGREAKSHANIVRSYVARWLTEFEDVQAYCSALPHHGGGGACYVALRKTVQAKQDNWERHAKRSR
ncbi:DNA endonuclease SmrA [Salmonella enterica subsp. enterica]|uniref:DNA endonuclease SmrA n=1 Tax=Salmonella enterica I TaxID=59201 RepID=A0A379VQH5_SALET|nr:DNA endonuclease SmrA [Salmonella enterica subsp. enterica]